MSRGRGRGEGLDRDRAPVIWARNELASRSDRPHSRRAADIDRDADRGSGSSSWAHDQRDEVLDVQRVPNLPSARDVAGGAQALSEVVGEHPLGGGGASGP